MAKQQKNKLDTLRHSTSHILAAAVLEMFPKAKFGIGPTIENGFYYDFDNVIISETDLPEIEKRMRNLIKKDLKFKKEIVSFAEAKKLFKDQSYKLDLIKELQKNKKKISVYKTSDSKNVFFLDLCSGPHIDSTKKINPDAFKLLKIAGAYWRGDEKNKMLTRIYGVAFATKKELDEYLKMIEEAEKRDHRKLGKDLDLFSLPELAGGGLPVWHPKGAVVRQTIEDFWKKEHQAKDYKLVYSPHIGNINIWKKSGHLDFYRENLYSPIKIDTEEYLLKPMNCPFHIFIYQNQTRSYKDLPLRYAELGTVYRYERSGVLHGLTRVRGFTQDDAHIFCTPEQLSDELVRIIEFAVKMLKIFGFNDYDVFLSTRPEKFIGNEKIWDKATKALKYALDKTGLKYQVDPGEGVFYGPKIDIKIKDALDRAWQCTTIQVDFNLPERFDVSYIDGKGKKQQPIMIHHALLGSLERFIGVLIEHYAGAFPLWLAPEQIWILPIGSRHEEYAAKVAETLKAQNIRVVVKNENETIGKKIRNGELQKIPYILIVGDKEVENKTVNVRHYRRGQEGEIKIEKLIEKLQSEIKNKVI